MGDAQPRSRRSPAPAGLPLVLKIGSSSLVRSDGEVNDTAIGRVVEQVEAFWRCGRPTVLVSSGAVAAGALTLDGRPSDTTGLQVAASVGQTLLMSHYSRLFGAVDRSIGQVLLTIDVLQMRAQYLHARSTLTRMLKEGIVPIVNENDTVAIHGWNMGDNDRLAAIVSHLVGAGMVVLLTDTDGLYTADPRTGEGDPIPLVAHRNPILDELAAGAPGPVGSGGVRTKVAAARMAAWSGIPTLIVKSTQPDLINMIVEGETVGTYVEPGRTKLSAWKLWLAFGEQPGGVLKIDEGAARALARRGSSLLPVGVTGVDGEFPPGALVEVRDQAGALVAKGLASVSSGRVRQWMGRRTDELNSGEEIIHRDRMVVLYNEWY